MSNNANEAIVAARYARAATVVLVLIVAVCHLGYDVLIIARGWERYAPLAATIGAWLALTVIQIAGSVLLLRSQLSAPTARTLATLAVAAGAVATVAYPPKHGPISDMGWAWNTVGWFGVLLLLHQPLWHLIVLLAVNTAVTVVFMAVRRELDQVMTARLLATVYTTAGIQAIFGFLLHQLNLAAEEAEHRASDEAEHLARVTADETVHRERQRRYEYLRSRVEPLLRGLSERRLNPAAPEVRRITGIEAARLRRLFAETDDTPHPLLHELRACADIAERRGVRVTLLTYGDLPVLATSDRRALSEAPLLVLASAETYARLTVLATPDEIVVSVVADAPSETLASSVWPLATSVQHDPEEDQLWVETRLTVPLLESRSASSMITPSSSKGSRHG